MEDWKEHKRDCKELAAGRFANVENRRRNEVSNFLSEKGFQTIDMTGKGKA